VGACVEGDDGVGATPLSGGTDTPGCSGGSPPPGENAGNSQHS